MTKLTSRDKKILWSCGVSQVLTTSQIQRWHFGTTCLRNVQKRLQKLTEAGFLNVIETKSVRITLSSWAKKDKPNCKKPAGRWN